MEDVFHSGRIASMTVQEKIDIRDELANLWILINGTEIVPGMSEQQVRDALSPPTESYANIWLYPSSFSSYYYRLEFESGVIKTTNFVALKIS